MSHHRPPARIIVLKVDIKSCKICHEKVKKDIFKLDGECSVAIDQEKKWVSITTYKLEPKILLRIFDKMGKKADVVSFREEEVGEPENNQYNNPHEEDRNKYARGKGTFENDEDCYNYEEKPPQARRNKGKFREDEDCYHHEKPPQARRNKGTFKEYEDCYHHEKPPHARRKETFEDDADCCHNEKPPHVIEDYVPPDDSMCRDKYCQTHHRNPTMPGFPLRRPPGPFYHGGPPRGYAPPPSMPFSGWNQSGYPPYDYYPPQPRMRPLQPRPYGYYNY